jgi:cell division protein FtsL
MKDTIRLFKETVELQSSAGTKSRWRRYSVGTFLFLLLLSIACLLIWQRVRVLELVKEVDTLEQKREDLLDDSRKLRSEIAQLSAPTRVTGYAMDSLGMMPVPLDRFYALLPPDMGDTTVRKTEWAKLVGSAERLWVNIPGVENDAEAFASGLDTLRLDSLKALEAGSAK